MTAVVVYDVPDRVSHHDVCSLRSLYGCAHYVIGWVPTRARLLSDTLYLCRVRPPASDHYLAVSYGEAMALGRGD